MSEFELEHEEGVKKSKIKKAIIFLFLAIALITLIFLIQKYSFKQNTNLSDMMDINIQGYSAAEINNGVVTGNFVLVDYIGYLEDGTIFDTSIKEEAEKAGIYSPLNIYKPLQFQVGSKQIINGIENAVIGMEKGEEKEIEIGPKDVYGEYNSQLIKKIPKDTLPPGQELKPGMMLTVKTPEGMQIPGRITEVTDKEVAIDLNHPLAGKTLKLKLILVNISNESFVVSYENIKEEEKQTNCPDTIEGNIDTLLKIKYFYSPFCPWCIKEEPILKELIEKYGHLFNIERYDVRYCLEGVIRYKVSGTPAFVFSIENGTKEFFHPGFIKRDKLKEIICGITKGCV